MRKYSRHICSIAACTLIVIYGCSPQAQPAPKNTPAQASFFYEKQIGMAIARDKNSCLAIYDPSIKPGAKFFLVHQPALGDTADPEVTEAAVAERLSEPCDDHIDNGDRDGVGLTFYRFQPGNPGFNVRFAVFNPVGALTVRDRKLDADLDGDSTKESFRVCASNEGVHHQVWTGVPLDGQPRWHWYFYAGYDTQPTCTEREYFGPK